MPRKNWIIVGSIAGIGFLFRVFLSIYNGPNPIFPDTVGYLENAHYLLTGEGTFQYKSPLYSLFIAFIYSLLPKSIFCIRIAQAFIWIGIVFIYSFISFKIFKSRRILFLVAMLLSLHPLLIYISSIALSETLYIFCYSLVLLLATNYMTSGKLISVLFLGLFLGLAYLTRNIAFTFLPFFIFWFFMINENKTLKFRSSLIFVAGFLIMASPYILKIYQKYDVWSLHSYGTFNSWRLIVSPLHKGTGRPIIGQLKFNHMTPTQRKELEKYTPVVREDMSRKEKDQLYKEALIRYINENPGPMFRKTIKKIIGIFSLTERTDSGVMATQSPIEKYIVSISAGFVYLFFFIGLFLIKGNFRRLFPVLGIILGSFVVFSVFSSRIRYTMSIYPVMILFSAYGFDWVLSRLNGLLSSTILRIQTLKSTQ